MDSASITKAAALLINARRTRQPLDRLPGDCRPATLDDALRIQAATVRSIGETVAGWKVGALVDGKLSYGVLLGSRIVASGGSVDAIDMPLLGMEAEIAFRFLRDAAPRKTAYTYDEIAECVVAFPAIEIVATRYRDYKGTPLIERIADCMSNGAFVAGEPQPEWRGMDLVNIHASLEFGATVVAQGVGGHVAGDPLRPAIDLVNALRTGEGVRAGQVMTTGTYTGLHYATPGTRVRAVFDGFGAATVDIR
jgi:2-keto-4-pentenoate hydratase